MSKIKELEELLKNDVLVELEATIKEMEENGAKKKTKAQKEEINYLKDVKKYFDEVIDDIKADKLSKNDAIDILEGLEDMRAENQEV